tara:strand:+ start:1188 stop:1607 length:420 start_codon:yes stop_codon:yes gene_type:complete
MKLSKNFSDYEFKNATPDPGLLSILQGTRDVIDSTIKITDSTRTINEHINLYKRIHGEAWMEKIPWKSRHLPCWKTSYLRAVDFKATKADGSPWKGAMLAEAVKSVAKDLNIHIGLGVGSQFIHLDIDRGAFVSWGYEY